MSLDKFVGFSNYKKKITKERSVDDFAIMDLVQTIISEENLNQVKVFEKLPKETRILFIVCGKYDETYGAISKGRIMSYCLTTIRDIYPSRKVFISSWDTLNKHLGWIKYSGLKAGWYSLSSKGFTVYSQLDEDFMEKYTPNLEMVCGAIRNIEMPAQFGGPKRPKKFIGYDLLIYYDVGEIDRIMSQVRRKDEFYGNCMIVCYSEKDKNLQILIKALEHYVNSDPIIIEHEGWRPKDLPKQLKTFLETRRYKLRFICTAYPRIGVFFIVGHLMKILNDFGYFVDFDYARAKNYCYEKGSPEKLQVVPSNKRRFERLFWLGEVNSIRLNEILPELDFGEFHVIMNEDIIGHVSLNPEIKRVLSKVYKKKPIIHYFNLTDLNSIIYKLVKFKLNKEDCVILGGNRFAVIGAAILFYTMLEREEEPFGIAWLHIDSETYSKGVEGFYNHRLYARHVDEYILNELNKIGGEYGGI